MLIEWIKDGWLDIVETFNEETEEADCYPVEVFQGNQDEVDITEDNGQAVDMQFGNGSMAYGVGRSMFIEVQE